MPILYSKIPRLKTIMTWISVKSNKNANETKKETKYL